MKQHVFNLYKFLNRKAESETQETKMEESVTKF
jgi:hypothetical protein